MGSWTHKPEKRQAMKEDRQAARRELAEADAPCCGKCGAPITTGAMAMLCPHGRQCEFVDGDEHRQQVEELREELGIERVKPPNVFSPSPSETLP